MGKASQLLLRLLGRPATYFSGRLALKLCPDFLYHIGRPELLVGITGTNGKTTVCNLVSDMLSELGEDPVSNRYGSNIDAGAATALLDAANLLGKCKKKIGVLEMDERSAAKLFPALRPDYLLITNLFRDSMRRNAHPEYIMSLLEQNIPAATRLVLNADDPISCRVAPLNSRAYFGMDVQPFEPPVRENLVQDVRYCPVCCEQIVYDFRRYNHIGHAHCTHCGWVSPKADYQLISADMETGTMNIMDGATWQEYKAPGDAVYNLYNALAAVSMLRELGYSREEIASALGKISIVQSRFWQETIGGKELTEIMAKGLNAVACSRNFDYVANSSGRRCVVLLLDDVFDEKSSSENTAWLYDADFEFLNDETIPQILAVGVRCLDTKLRLLIAGIPEERITVVPNADDVANAVRLAQCDKVFILYEVYRHEQAVKVRNAVSERMKQL